MAPWTESAPLLQAIEKHLSRKVALTRYGLRSAPEERWFLIVLFADREKRMVPWLIWLERAKSGEMEMRDRCPLDTLVTFKAGKWCADSPGFAPYIVEGGIVSSANDLVTGAERDPVIRELPGCMVLGFSKRLLELHCTSREDWSTLVRVFKAIVQVNNEAKKQAKAGSGGAAGPSKAEGPGMASQYTLDGGFAGSQVQKPHQQHPPPPPDVPPSNLHLQTLPPRQGTASVPVKGEI